MKRKAGVKELLYLKIASSLEQQISNDVLKVGDKLPSIRMICRQHGVSMSTAQFAYYELEAKSLIEPRPQSGFYVSNSFRKKLAIPEASRPENKPAAKTVTDIIENSFNPSGEKNFTVFSRGVPATQLLPVVKLNKAMIQAVRSLPGGGTTYEPLQGNEKLRTQVAKWSFNWKGNLSEKDIFTTAGCMSAISYCLMALTKTGRYDCCREPLLLWYFTTGTKSGIEDPGTAYQPANRCGYGIAEENCAKNKTGHLHSGKQF